MKKGKFYESDYEEALVDLLESQGWTYTFGGDIARNNREVLLADELTTYLKKRYVDLTDSDIEEIINHLRHTGGQTHFELLRNTYYLVRDGYRYTRNSDGKIFDIEYLDFETDNENNIYRCVNQFEVGYGLKADIRIPDVLLFINGIPLCIFELKNPKKVALPSPNISSSMCFAAEAVFLPTPITITIMSVTTAIHFNTVAYRWRK